MAIRTKQYKTRGRGKKVTVRAIRITDRNCQAIVDWVNKRGGLAYGRHKVDENGDLYHNRVVVYQINPGKDHARKGWRTGQVGDFIVQYEDGSFARVKDDVFEATYVLA